MAIQAIELRSPFNYDRDKVSEETGLLCTDLSLTQQHQKEEADINTIVKRFGLTGELPQGVKAPRFGDFTEVRDYQTALNAVIEANTAFNMMPAEIRSRFNNDPEKFVEFCSDDKNRVEAEKLGLVFPKEAPAPPTAMPESGKDAIAPVEGAKV